MIEIQLNEHTAEDVKLIQELKQMGVPEDIIEAAYNNTQKAREHENDG